MVVRLLTNRGTCSTQVGRIDGVAKWHSPRLKRGYPGFDSLRRQFFLGRDPICLLFFSHMLAAAKALGAGLAAIAFRRARSSAGAPRIFFLDGKGSAVIKGSVAFTKEALARSFDVPVAHVFKASELKDTHYRELKALVDVHGLIYCVISVESGEGYVGSSVSPEGGFISYLNRVRAHLRADGRGTGSKELARRIQSGAISPDSLYVIALEIVEWPGDGNRRPWLVREDHFVRKFQSVWNVVSPLTCRPLGNVVPYTHTEETLAKMRAASSLRPQNLYKVTCTASGRTWKDQTLLGVLALTGFSKTRVYAYLQATGGQSFSHKGWRVVKTFSGPGSRYRSNPKGFRVPVCLRSPIPCFSPLGVPS